FQGHWAGPSASSTTADNAVGLAAQPAKAAQDNKPAGRDALQASSKQNSLFRDLLNFSDDRGQGQSEKAVAAGSPRETVASAAAISHATAADSKSQPSDDAAASSSGKDSQVLMAAAKISPDLKDIDPDAPVDVIVQYRRSPAANELTDDGAETK